MGRVKPKKITNLRTERRRRMRKKFEDFAMIGYENLIDELQELRAKVENQGRGKMRLINGVYQTPSLDHIESTNIMAGDVHWEFGYQVKPAPTAIQPNRFQRRIWIVAHNERLSELPDEVMAECLAAVYSACLDPGQGYPENVTSTDAQDRMMVQQYFQPGVIEHQNSLVLPGTAGRV